MIIHSLIVGTRGPTIVMMHGWGQNLSSMQQLGERLSHNATVHLLDLPGFGASDMPDGDWTTLQYADAVNTHIAQTHTTPVHLVGHSFGGRVAIQLASHFPETVQTLTLISAAGLPPKRSILQKLRLMAIRKCLILSVELKPIIGEHLHVWLRERFGSSDYRAAGSLKGVLIKAVNEDLSQEASSIRQRTLLLWGSEDRDTPPEMGRRFNHLIPDSQFIELPGRDHFPFAGTGVHLCAHYISRFVGDPSSVQDAG